MGGIPRYWELAKPFPDLGTACKELVLDRDGVLHDEPVRLLLDDMRGASQSHSLLALIAGGANRLSEIAGRLGKPATNMTRPLSNLIQLGLIKREIPFGTSHRAGKKSLYRVADPFLLFWYRLVPPNRSMLEQDMVEEVYAASAQQIGAQIAEVWEELARISISRFEIAGHRWKPASRWWGNGLDGKKMEIDVVSESIDGKYLLVGEAKWEAKTKVSAIKKRLEKKAENFPLLKNRTVFTAVWCKQSGNHVEDEVFTPEDVLKALR